MIYKATPDFDFSKLHLGSPVPLQGGSFFTKITTVDILMCFSFALNEEVELV